ncbi:hypothetical protein [Mycobacterium sp. FLAC0960]|nr:hypothetical protein [Mycobacterium sp. FLAC0960]MDM4141646.1 hypothetical protein [Mycobacterium sp. FLAC0960]
MADRLDVAARLAEGRDFVEHTQAYVQACHALGYENADLTTHPARVREWYAGADGLDLRALDRDCAELRAAGVVAVEALRMQRAQVAELAAAWTGPGGDAAVQLLQRHCDAADAVATELRAAAQRYESLRDNLWYLVDSEVATVTAVDDRVRVHRPAWLAAAAAVTAGDRDGAADVVRQQVMPYVDNDIRGDWLTAVRAASDGVDTSYAMVVDKMAAVPTARFEFPGDLGTGAAPAPLAPPAQPAPTLTAAAPVTAAPVPLTAAPDSVTPAPPPIAAATPLPADWGAGLGDGLGLPAGALGGLGGGDLGGGLGDGGLGGGGVGGGGGLLGLAGRLVDAVGGLIGSAGDGLDGADPFTDPGEGGVDENPFHPEGLEDTDVKTAADDAPADDTEEAEQAQPVDAPESQPDGSIPPVEAPAPAGATPADPAPTDPAPTDPAPGEPPAPPAAPAAQPAPATDQAKTPCEIAADQLPQAGQ